MFKSVREVLNEVVNSNTQEVHKQIAKEILKNFDQNILIKQKDLAEICFISESTITLFAKGLGYDGYRELYLRLKVENEYYHFDFKKQVNEDGVNLISIREEINRSFEFIDQQDKQISDFVNEIKQYNTIYLFSSYEQIYNTQMFSGGLKSTSKNVNFEPIRNWDADSLSNITTDNLAIFIISGLDNDNLIKTYHNLLEKGIKILVISSTSQAIKIIKPMGFVDLGIRTKEPVTLYARSIILNYIFTKILLNL